MSEVVFSSSVLNLILTTNGHMLCSQNGIRPIPACSCLLTELCRTSRVPDEDKMSALWKVKDHTIRAHVLVHIPGTSRSLCWLRSKVF